MDEPDSSRAVHSWSRGPALPSATPGSGPGPSQRDGARKEMIAYLAAVPRWPGADGIARAAATEAEVDSMSPRERVFLELEMIERRRERPSHTYDYDPLAVGRL